MPCTIMGLCTRNSVRGVAEFFCNVEAKAHEKYAATIKFQYPQAGRERTLTLACPEGKYTQQILMSQVKMHKGEKLCNLLWKAKDRSLVSIRGAYVLCKSERL